MAGICAAALCSGTSSTPTRQPHRSLLQQSPLCRTIMTQYLVPPEPIPTIPVMLRSGDDADDNDKTMVFPVRRIYCVD